MNTSAVRSSSSVFICSAVIPRVPAQITASFIPAIARLSVVGCFLADRIGPCELLPGIFSPGEQGDRGQRWAEGCVTCSDPSASRYPFLSAPQKRGYASSPGDGMLEWWMLLDSCLGYVRGEVLHCEVLPVSIHNHIALPCKYRSGKGTDFSLFFFSQKGK